MEKREVAIKITNVKKKYRLGQIGGTTLQEAIQSYTARISGKEDPNTKLGAEQRIFKKTFMALNGIDITVYKGEALGIIGCNGAGKSTLLKILSRITAPTEGEIDIYGRVTSMLEVGTGFNGEMTGRENIYMNGAILGMTKKEIDAKIEDIIDFSEVREFIDTPVKRYSSGMYVKLAFAVAAHLDSEILIMDEVLAVGDMKFQKKCLGKMGNAANYEGKTVLYVSHNMETIRQLCTRCIVLKEGKVIYDGEVEDAINIYMENHVDTGCTYYQYVTDETMLRNQGVKIAQIAWLRFSERKNVIYYAGELLKFDVCIFAGKRINELCLRLEVRFADMTPVGTVPELLLGDFEQGERKEYRIGLDTSWFTRGKYLVYLVLFKKNDLGMSHDYDLIMPAFGFEITDELNICWNMNTWGHIKLPDLTCEEMTHE